MSEGKLYLLGFSREIEALVWGEGGSGGGKEREREKGGLF